jgi:hypothetical protein
MARYGDFPKGSWHYWHIRLSISPILPDPKNKFLAKNEEVRFPGKQTSLNKIAHLTPSSLSNILD